MSDLSTIKVLVVDDHPLTQAGLGNFMSAFPDLSLVGMVDTGEEAIAFCEHDEPDVILMDLLMPGMGGVAATRVIKERHPDVRIIALTSSAESDSVKAALQAHAIGYLLKTATAFELAFAIRSAMDGRSVISEEADKVLAQSRRETPEFSGELTDRERQVLGLVALGMSNKQVAEQLSIELPTVKFHLRNLFVKLGTTRRSELITRAYQMKLL